MVWVGMDQPTEKTRINLTGASSALPVWVTFMKKALSKENPISFPPSPLLTDIEIDLHSGKAARSNCPPAQVIHEKYIQGHEPKEKTCEPLWPASSNQTRTD